MLDKRYLIETKNNPIERFNEDNDDKAGNDYQSQGSCKPGWRFFAHTGNCYKYFNGRYTWQSARDLCKTENPDSGDTISIPDRQTNDFLAGITRSPVWTSGKKVGNHWQWGDGTRIGYTNWMRGQPRNYLGKEYLLEFNVFYRRGLWNDRPDTWKICTICQYHVGSDYGGGQNCLDILVKLSPTTACQATPAHQN